VVVGRERPWLAGAYLLVFAGAVAVTRRFPGWALVPVLGLLYSIHAVMLLLAGAPGLGHFLPLSLALLGIILARPRPGSWSLPPLWKLPLVFWALVIALSWPLLFLRELDFAPLQTLGLPLAGNGRGVPAAESAAWVLHAAVTQGVALLWIDWLWGRFRKREDLERLVILPLAGGFLVACLVGFYQAFADLAFLNAPHWVDAGRAGGALMDGNHFGILAALWGPALVVLLWRRARPHRLLPATLALAAGGIATLISGSTSALFILLPCTLYLVWLGWRHRKRLMGETRAGELAAAVAVVLVLMAVLGLSGNRNSFRRLGLYLSASEDASVSGLISSSLRDRPLYARLAWHGVAESPVAGVGVGTFNVLSADIAERHGLETDLVFENALNWYLHQLAELGWLGSLGWLAWIGIFAFTLARARAPGSTRLRAAILKWVLITFGVASLFGVHAQSPEVILTFWTFVFWLCLLLSEQPEAGSPAAAATHPSPGTAGRTGSFLSGTGDRTGLPESVSRMGGTTVVWLILLGLALAYTATLGLASVGRLSVPERAAAAGWNYEYGFHALEQDPRHGSFRWTDGKAVTIVPVNGRPLEATFWVRHPDVSERPVRVRVRAGATPVLDLLLRDQEPVSRILPVPAGVERLPLIIETGRTWRPSDHGRPDSRRLGVAVALALAD